MSDYKTIGILGGMGPLAGIDLHRRIVMQTSHAKKDQEHIPVLHYSFPQIPDRTAFLLGEGPDPTPYLCEGLVRLQSAGVDAVCMACNTAHRFVPSLRECLEVPLISMIESTWQYIECYHSRISKIGLLATTGTVRTGVYLPSDRNFELLVPNVWDQKHLVMEAIYGESGLKAGYVGSQQLHLIRQAAQNLIDAGAELIILGCTELSLLAPELILPVPKVDAMDELVVALLDFAINSNIRNSYQHVSGEARH